MTKQSLTNLKPKFNLDPSKFNDNDAISVDCFVKQFKEDGNHILMYKIKGELSSGKS